MNEQNEIRGDEIEDVQDSEAERIDAWENSPEPHPPTQAELEDMFQSQDNGLFEDDGDTDVQEMYDSFEPTDDWRERLDRDTEEHQEEMSRILEETYPDE